jgi:hypothetical protein
MLATIGDSQPLTSYETVLNKVFDITQITILTGSERDVCNDTDHIGPIVGSTIVALLDGTSRIYYRVVKYETDIMTNPHNNDNIGCSRYRV